MKARLTWFLCTSLERWRLGYGLFEYIVSVEPLELQGSTTLPISTAIHFSRPVRRAQEISYVDCAVYYDDDAGKDTLVLAPQGDR